MTKLGNVESEHMAYFKTLKEIQQLQWELFIDYLFIHLVIIVLGLGIVIFVVFKK